MRLWCQQHKLALGISTLAVTVAYMSIAFIFGGTTATVAGIGYLCVLVTIMSITELAAAQERRRRRRNELD